MWNIKQNKIALIIAASCFSIIGLIYFQAKWMQQSRELLEEQFDQKVSMALCSAVEDLKDAEPSTTAKAACNIDGPKPSCEQQIDALEKSPDFDKKICSAMDFYQVGIDYEAKIVDKSTVPEDSISPYCCSMEPILDSDSHLLTVAFPTKEDYVYEKMGFMFFASILILLFVVIVFLQANYMLLKQRRVTEFNIDFFNNMAHEFRTPLTNITLATKLLGKKEEDLQDNKFVKIIHSESKHLMLQVDRLLHLAKLENGDYQMKKEPIDLNRLLTEVLKCMDLRIKENNMDIQLDLYHTNAQILGDPLHLGNAFRNLIDNAIKYASEQPSLKISIEEIDGYINLRFEDNGQGISKKEQEFIFNKFHRAKEKDTSKGFGIGLAYVKMIMDKHAGKINVWSELQKGTRFDLALPKL